MLLLDFGCPRRPRCQPALGSTRLCMWTSVFRFYEASRNTQRDSSPLLLPGRPALNVELGGGRSADYFSAPFFFDSFSCFVTGKGCSFDLLGSRQGINYIYSVPAVSVVPSFNACRHYAPEDMKCRGSVHTRAIHSIMTGSTALPL